MHAVDNILIRSLLLTIYLNTLLVEFIYPYKINKFDLGKLFQTIYPQSTLRSGVILNDERQGSMGGYINI
jgi:hypothetical protein